MQPNVTYQRDTSVTADEFIDVLNRSGLAERRPVGDRERIGKMLEHANLIVTARDESGALIGVARSLTDFAYCCYLSDIAVDRDWQRQRIGQRLIEETRRLATRQAKLILLTAPDAAGYYPHIGMTNATNCWVMERV